MSRRAEESRIFFDSSSHRFLNTGRVLPLAYGLFTVLDRTVGLRVEAHPEALGLDLYKHANQAYPEFVAAEQTGDGFAVAADEFIPAEV